MLSSLHIIFSAPPWLILRDSVVCEYLPPPPTCAVSGGSVFVGGGDYSLTTFSSNVTPLSVATRMM